LDAYTWYRYSLIEPFLVKGPIRALNIGTGGGVETLRLLRRGNYVTTIEVDKHTAQRTCRRIARNGYADRHRGLTGHVLSVKLEMNFHEILMCEVLEHIADDFAVLQRLSEWLLPGGRLILSTPTASYGQLSGDQVSIEENGGHVRVGYDGPELDDMLKRVELLPLRRIYNGSQLVRLHHCLERKLRKRPTTRLIGHAFSLFSRPLLPWLDLFTYRPFDQITIAVKKHKP
jgi:SAM-dependent methyltransferase